ncbi:protein phosphatase 1 regulatory subunit 3C-B [Brachyistius frenatus]|uniref:protein phosphatase 1 regulatory subunit 3C-B n=1 Tax=Brachyistius frenatus TaxID=100188 RepID=UPI0037E7CA61
MNCTRVLHAFGHSQPAVTPVDLAVCLSLSQRQPLYQLLSISPLKPPQQRSQPADTPPRNSLRYPHLPSSTSLSTWSLLPSSHAPSELRSCFRRGGGGSKKRVVFADAKGLALTAVHLFMPGPSSPTSTLVRRSSPTKLEPSTPNKVQRHKLWLGFPQPTLDFKAFLARLRETHVQLESCHLSEYSLSGRVCASHVGAERAVHIRLTFDSWRSHRDIPCTFVQQQRCGGSDIDVFTFDLSLPQNTDPKERIEFCLSFRPRPGRGPHWDDNRGQNYKVCIEQDGSNANQGNVNRCQPTLSKQRPPSWPAQMSASVQNHADLQYPQRSLSNRVRVDWTSMYATR